MNKKTVLAVIEKYAMLKPGDTVVVGFSGGADSVSLLHILIELKDEYELNLTAAHINHGIRGKEAERDEEFCRSFCEEHGVRFAVLHADVPNEAKSASMSEEEYGRKIRYAFFHSLAGETGKIATAHNLNDCVETLLFNIARGTGSKGACSIPAVRGNIIRPLIETPREEIESYCVENSLSFVTDSTNYENEYSRNKIRNVVIPALKEINSSAVTAASRFIQSIKQDEEYLSELCEKEYMNCFEGGALIEEKLASLPIPILKRVILKYLSEKTESDISAKHIDDIISLIGTNKSVNSAGGLKIQSRKGFVGVFEETQNALPFEIEIKKANGAFEYPYGKVIIEISEIKDLQILNKEDMDNCIDCDKISNTLFLRSRKAGDELTLRKRGVTKSLKKLFNEEGIDAAQRNKIAVLSDGEHVIWVSSFGVSKKYSVGKNTERVMKIMLNEFKG